MEKWLDKCSFSDRLEHILETARSNIIASPFQQHFPEKIIFIPVNLPSESRRGDGKTYSFWHIDG
jgi:hypothetical protein